MNDRFAVHPPHDLLWVSGGDAVTFLDGLVSQSVAAMAPGEVRRSLLLTPRGKLEAVLWLLADADRVGVAVDAGHGAAVAAALSRFKIRVDVAIAPEQRPLHEVWGTANGAPLVAERRWRDEGELTADLPSIHGGLRMVLTTAAVPDEAPVELAEATRIVAGEPRLGVDIDGDTIPQEAGLVEGAVDFTKGCYLGQELVARIDSRGHVNRRLRGLRAASPITPGAELVSEGRAVGTVTSAAVSPTLGAVALAVVRREVEVGSEVEVGDGAATVTDLPIG